MPGRLFQPATRLWLSGLSSGKLPRIPKRFGYLAAAASATAPELGSQPGGWISAALTPPASISFRQSSADQDGIWRCAAFVGRPCNHRWICASTISMDVLLLLVIPAQAGIQEPVPRRSPWTPAFAGVTIVAWWCA